MTGSTCVKCGLGTIERAGGKNRTSAYKHIPDLPISDEIQVPTCTNCGSRYVNRATAVALDAALEASYRTTVSDKTREAIRHLCLTYRKLELEALLGLSAGYLSKLVGEGNQPSPQIAACLMLLANDPGRVEELRRSWRIGLPELRAAPLTHTATATNVKLSALDADETNSLVVNVESQAAA